MNPLTTVPAWLCLFLAACEMGAGSGPNEESVRTPVKRVSTASEKGDGPITFMDDKTASLPYEPGSSLPKRSPEATLDMGKTDPTQAEHYREALRLAREFLSQLGVTRSDEDSLEAGVELLALAGTSDVVACGLIESYSIYPGALDQVNFPFTHVKFHPSLQVNCLGTVLSQIEFAFWGGELDQQYFFTSATPDIGPGEQACVFLRGPGPRLWISGKNAYLRIDPDGLVGLGYVRAKPDELLMALKPYLPTQP